MSRHNNGSPYSDTAHGLQCWCTVCFKKGFVYGSRINYSISLLLWLLTRSAYLYRYDLNNSSPAEDRHAFSYRSAVRLPCAMLLLLTPASISTEFGGKCLGKFERARASIGGHFVSSSTKNRVEAKRRWQFVSFRHDLGCYPSALSHFLFGKRWGPCCNLQLVLDRSIVGFGAASNQKGRSSFQIASERQDCVIQDGTFSKVVNRGWCALWRWLFAF